MRRIVILGVVLLVGLCGTCSLLGVALTSSPGPYQAADLRELRVYAYRNWQSTGVYLHPGDVFTVRASGEWSYTPGEFNGPGGHRRYPAPAFYPIPNVRGGCLIGRIGEEGQAFFVGDHLTRPAGAEGLLYLRINDDILSDNVGWMVVQVTVQYPTPTTGAGASAPGVGTIDARSGSQWGDDIDGSYVNHLDSGDPYETGLTPVGYYDGGTHGSFSTHDGASPYGAYDMAGNVYGWCSDYYGEDYYQTCLDWAAWPS